jgi:hypothetical protein
MSSAILQLAASDVRYACDACACRDCMHAEDARKERAVRARDEYDAMRAVVEAALRLRDSGYDGPFIGDITVEIFDALAAYERRDSTTRGGTK